LNAYFIDSPDAFQADIGVKEGLIVAIGKAGNPGIMEGVHPEMIIGVNTEVRSAFPLSA
jgi:urease